jgi:inosine/xanthosine triphosphate pyrophosphatase family protein
VSAAETIQAAIDKLEAQRTFATKGQWAVTDDGDLCVVGGSTEVAYFRWMANTFNPDAELIVTLHRTIDAQLALFRSSIWLLSIDRLTETHAAVQGTIDLAHAILGESS